MILGTGNKKTKLLIVNFIQNHRISLNYRTFRRDLLCFRTKLNAFKTFPAGLSVLNFHCLGKTLNFSTTPKGFQNNTPCNPAALRGGAQSGHEPRSDGKLENTSPCYRGTYCCLRFKYLKKFRLT